MKEIKLRPADWNDCRNIWNWRNDKITRRFSFNAKYIPLKTHLIWFRKALKDKNKRIFMIEEDGRSTGMVRFDIINPKEKVAEINIIIAPEKRGQGIGLLATKTGVRYIFKSQNIKKIIARIKKENSPSIKMFTKAGFIRFKEDNKIIIMSLTPLSFKGH